MLKSARKSPASWVKSWFGNKTEPKRNTRRRRLPAAGHVEALETKALLAATPQLVADINTQIATDSVGAAVFNGNGLAYFAATTDQGRELWKSDGTRGGTRLVKDINPGPDSGASVSSFATVGEFSYFAADDGIHGVELWKTDGTEDGTSLVKDIDPTVTSSRAYSGGAAHLTAVGSLVYFVAEDPDHRDALWVSDGTEVGTRLVKDVRPGNSANSSITGLIDVGGTLFFSANDGTSGSELWVSDGTDAGTRMVKDINPGSAGAFPNEKTVIGNNVYFTANDGTHGVELWKSDGTTAGTVLVADIYPGSSSSSTGGFFVVDQTVFFRADDGVSGAELWKSDGTTEGTTLVKDIYPGQRDSRPGVVANLNGTLILSADGGSANGRRELWKSDGTETGTVLLKDIRPGSGSSSPSGGSMMTVLGDSLLFLANDGVHGEAFWKTDGTELGTVLVKDINPSPSSSNVAYLYSTGTINGELIFSGNDGSTGIELWKSDGTEEGTTQIKDIRHGSGSNIRNLTSVGGALYFSADDGSNVGNELWRSTGSGTGTGLLADIWPGTKSSNADNFTAFANRVFFSADDGTLGTELWSTDGTPGGTELFKDIMVGWNDSSPTQLTVVDDKLFFSADSSAYRELWVSDGTQAGTTIVKDIQPYGGAYPEQLTNVDGMLFFSARSGFLNDRELWISDGTEDGTFEVKNINPTLGFDIADSDPEQLTSYNGMLIFTAVDGSNGRELWISDGTKNGTTMLKDINPGVEGSAPESFTEVDGKLYFSAFDAAHGIELWVTDGTSEGTQVVKDIFPGMENARPRYLTELDGTLYFSANDGERGTELWRSDGTEAGTVRIHDILPGPTGSVPQFLADANGTLVFSADNGINGAELWQSDGTEEGTTLVADMNNVNSIDGSFPRDLIRVENHLFFVATDHPSGSELWLLSENDLPVITFDGLSQDVSEDSGVIRVEAQLDEAQSFDVTFPVSVGASAALDSDFSFLTNQSLFFPAGETTGWLELSIVDDGIREDAEAIEITIDSTALALFGPSITKTINIADNDSLPGIAFSSETQFVQESVGTVTVELVLSAPSNDAIVIPLNVSGSAVLSSDYSMPGGTTVTIPAGNTTFTATLDIVDDITPESAERIEFSIGTPTNAVVSDDPAKPRNHTVIIQANDEPSVSFDSSWRPVGEDVGTVSVTVYLSPPSSIDVTVPFAVTGTADTQDFVIDPNPIIIPAGSISAVLDVQIVDDAIPESYYESVVLSLEMPTGAVLGETTSLQLGIRDNDKATIGFATRSQTVYESAGEIEFTVNVSPVPEFDIPFDVFASSGGSNAPNAASSNGDYTLVDSSLILRAGESTVSGTLRINDDTSIEGTEFLKISFTNWQPLAFNVDQQAISHTIWIEDNEQIATLERWEPVRANRFKVGQLREDDAELLFYVNLNSPAENAVDIPFQIIGDAALGADYTVTPSNGVVRINAGGTFNVDGIRVNIKEDLLVEGTEKFTVLLGEPSSPSVTLGRYTSSTVEILDDDLSPTVSFGFKSKFANEADGIVSIPVEMTTQTNKDAYVTLEFGGTATQNADYVVEGIDRNNRLKIPAFTNQATLDIRLLDDSEFDPGESIEVRIVRIENASILHTTGRTVTLSLFDNDARATPPKPEPSSSYARYVDEFDTASGRIHLPENGITGPVPTIKQADSLSFSTGSLALPPSHQHGEIISWRHEVNGKNSADVKRDNAVSFVVEGGAEFFKAFQGQLRDGTAFFDGNLNGVPDFLDLNSNGLRDIGEPSEPVTQTELDGGFSLIIPAGFDRNNDGLIQVGEGQTIITGGVDAAIDVPWATHMIAPPGFRLATPVTTLISSMIYDHGQDTETAELRVLDGLGLNGIDIRQLDSLYGIGNGDATAALEYSTHVKLYNTVSTIAALFAGASGQSTTGLGSIIYTELGRKILLADTSLDFDAQPVIEDLVRSVSFRLGISLTESVISGVGEIVSEGNQLVADVPFPIDLDYARHITRIKKVIQGDAASDLRRVGEQTVDIADVLSAFTGANLDSRVLNAQIGPLIPPVVGITDAIVREGDAGPTEMTFTVEISGEHDQEVTVDFSTFDMSATSLGGDFAGTSGTLIWAPGDLTPKTITVTISGDTLFEPDETVRVHLSNSENAVLRVEDGYGFIINDDIEMFQTASDHPATLTEIQISANSLRVSENANIVVNSDFLDPVQFEVTGRDNVDDEFVVDFSENSFRPDDLRFEGNDGVGSDKVSLQRGNFTSIRHQLFGSDNGTTVLDSINGSSSDVTVEWAGTEAFVLAVSQTGEFIVELPPGTEIVTIEDADPTDSNPELAGKMRLRSDDAQFAPVDFTAPDDLIRIVAADDVAQLIVLSVDPAFDGAIEFDVDAGANSPTDVSLTLSVIEENLSAGTVVGRLTTIDPDSGDTFTYSLVSGTGDTDNGAFTIVGDELRTAASLDFETKSSYSVRVRTADSGGLTFEKAFTILVSDVNESPSALAIDVASLPENMASGTLVGSFSTTDVDAGDSFTYSLVTGSGDSDNSLFTIVDDKLRTAASLDFENQSSYSIRVQTTDSGGLTFEKSFPISVTDEDEESPAATIQPLPLTWLSNTITLNVDLLDPNGPAGEPVSGVATYDVYVAIDSGGWTLFADDVPATQTQVVYAPQSNRRYWFRAIATDAAGNVEIDSGTPETNTHTVDFDAPVTQVTTATSDESTGIISLFFDGTDAGGSNLAQFEVYVSVDGGDAEQIVGSPVSAGAANNGVFSGAASYQGLRDGTEHTYRFYTRGIDNRGNQEAVPANSEDVTVVETFTAQAGYNPTGIDVQLGQTQRSYVRYTDIVFSNSAALIDLFSNGRIEVERFGIGTADPTQGSGALVSGFGATANNNSLRLDFGANGIGGRGSAGNGFYRISLDLDGDGEADDAHFEFFRLWGDANGDGRVDRDDTRNLFEDVNGDGRVDSRDRREIRRQLGQSLNNLLLPLLDD